MRFGLGLFQHGTNLGSLPHPRTAFQLQLIAVLAHSAAAWSFEVRSEMRHLIKCSGIPPPLEDTPHALDLVAQRRWPHRFSELCAKAVEVQRVKLVHSD
jgi:hypothetical protein